MRVVCGKSLLVFIGHTLSIRLPSSVGRAHDSYSCGRGFDPHGHGGCSTFELHLLGGHGQKLPGIVKQVQYFWGKLD